MEISRKGIELLKEFEGCVLSTYLCSAEVPTIGYGHTGDDVSMGMAITQAQADALLVKDLRRFEDAVNELVTVQLTQGQFDALVSFAFNIGDGAFSESLLLQMLNEGSHELAGDRMLLWNKVDGVPSEGLTRRRVAERHRYYAQPFVRK